MNKEELVNKLANQILRHYGQHGFLDVNELERCLGEMFEAGANGINIKKSFAQWYKNHGGASAEALWYIQNALGSILGFDHPTARVAVKAWHDKPGKNYGIYASAGVYDLTKMVISKKLDIATAALQELQVFIANREELDGRKMVPAYYQDEVHRIARTALSKIKGEKCNCNLDEQCELCTPSKPEACKQTAPVCINSEKDVNKPSLWDEFDEKFLNFENNGQTYLKGDESIESIKFFFKSKILNYLERIKRKKVPSTYLNARIRNNMANEINSLLADIRKEIV